jgi:hypothetical protein
MYKEQDICYIRYKQIVERQISDNFSKILIGFYRPIYMLVYELRKIVHFNICYPYINVKDNGIYFSTHYIDYKKGIYLDETNKHNGKDWNMLNNESYRQQIEDKLKTKLNITEDEFNKLEYSIYNETNDQWWDIVKEGEYPRLKTYLKNCYRKHKIKAIINNEKLLLKPNIKTQLDSKKEILLDEYNESVNGMYIPEGYIITFYRDTNFNGKPLLRLKGPYVISNNYPNLLIEDYKLTLKHTPDMNVTNLSSLINLPVKIERETSKEQFVIRGSDTNVEYNINKYEKRYKVFNNENEYKVWYKENIIDKKVNLKFAELEIENKISKIENDTLVENIECHLTDKQIFYNDMDYHHKVLRFKDMLLSQNDKLTPEDLNYLNELNENNSDIFIKLIPYFKIYKYDSFNWDDHQEVLNKIMFDHLEKFNYIFMGNSVDEIVDKAKALENNPNDYVQNKLYEHIKYDSLEHGIGYLKLKYAQKYTDFQNILNNYGDELLEYIEYDNLDYDETDDTQNPIYRYINVSDIDEDTINEELPIQRKNEIFGLNITPLNIEIKRIDNTNNYNVFTIYDE